MSTSLLAPHAPTLRNVIENAGVLSVEQIAKQPGMRAVYRVTVYHHSGRARDSVATLTCRTGEGVKLEVMYRATFAGKPLSYPVTETRYDALIRTLQAVRFDHLQDQPDIPSYGVDLWMLERAAGSFSKSLILAPDLADGVYTTLVESIQKNLPEAVREVR